LAPVIPAKAGIQLSNINLRVTAISNISLRALERRPFACRLDSRLRGNDVVVGRSILSAI
jgi:hypothetical protein